VSRAEDWTWSSARAHLAGEDDELATVAPLRALIPGFAALLTAPADPATTARIERAPTIRTAAWRAGMDRGAQAAARPPPARITVTVYNIGMHRDQRQPRPL